MACGAYKGRTVVDVAAQQERARRRKEKKERAIGEVTGQASGATKAADKKAETADEKQAPLSVEELSKKQ